ncbi:hypothetical protein C7E23_15475 [Elizabethkingia anophelis]|nr:hypothetical protein C7E23_15475 [Elizabethkingia anophelis]
MIRLTSQTKIDLYKLQWNDLLITRTGSIGTMALYKSNFIAIPSAYLIRCRLMNHHMADYIFRFLKSDYSIEYFGLNTKLGTRPNINAVSISNLIIALPSITIQESIVEKLDELMQYCDELENSVKESQQYNEMLLQQVLREALEGKEESKPQLKINKTCDNNDTAILASYIIQELNTPDFGRTKLQKNTSPCRISLQIRNTSSIL